MDFHTQTIIYGSLGGILPALFWLWFWLRQDKKRPEPRRLLFLSFVAGMLAVPIVIPLQRLVATDLINISLITIILWATIEEILKYIGSYVVALRNKAMDEPIDAMIYLITTALGFAALENTLFLVNSLSTTPVIETIITGNMRFIGATLLHTISSATIGIAIAMTFYRRKTIQGAGLFMGIVLAITLHSLFNFFIINTQDGQIFWAFAIVWILVVLLIMFFERIKNTKKNLERII